MPHKTMNSAITVNGRTWWVNSKKSGLFTHSVKAMINQVDAILTHHSKIHIIRFDLRLYQYTDDNELIKTFKRRFHKWLKREYNFKRIGFVWCREIEKAKQQHYHYALIIDGHKVNYPELVNKKAKEIWRQLDGSEYFPKRCYHNLKRDDYESIQEAIYRISYLAKTRGKGYKPDQTKNYSVSRIKHKKGTL